MLDRTGFKRQRFADLFEEMEAKAKEAFGEQVNTSERSVLGIILRLFAWFLANFWQNTEDVYYSAYKNTAEGNSLYRLGPYVGITPISERPASGAINITGTPNHTVHAGYRVATESGVYFETKADLVLDGSGKGNVGIQAVEPGRLGNVASGTIVVIVNPDPDVIAVTNPEKTAGGREKETDQEFRDRWDLSVAGGGAATVDSLRGALLRTPGVRAAVVIENTGSTPDSAGRPPKSFEAFTLGGAAAEIGQTILDTKAAGIEAHGSTSVVVNDIAGNPHTIKFSYATEVQVRVRVTVTKNASYPADGDRQIESSIVRYIGGEDEDGQLYVGLNMGEDVVHSRLIAAAYKVTGIDDVKIEVSTNGVTWAQTNVTIAPQEVAQSSYTVISVVYTP